MKNKKSPRLAPGAMCDKDSLEYTASAMMLVHKATKAARPKALARSHRLATSWLSGDMTALQLQVNAELCIRSIAETVASLLLAREIIERSARLQQLSGAAHASAKKKLDSSLITLRKAHATIEAQ